MATFLTTGKMNPALVARIEKSVNGPKTRRSGGLQRRMIAIARVMMVLTVIYGIYSYLKFRRAEQTALSDERAALLAAISAQSSELTDSEKNMVPRTETWLTKLSAPQFAGDVIDPELRSSPDALTSTLNTRTIVYVRGPIEGFQSSVKIAETAASSAKDSLALCLVEPPTARTEKVLIEKVRLANLAGSPLEMHTTNIRRLHDPIVGLPFLSPSYEKRVKDAADRTEVAKLKADFDKAPVDRTKQAAKAGLLLIAIDEPGDGKGPTELDGERPHFIRVALVDVGTPSSARVLLSIRKHVDPSWVSQAKRPTYSLGLDSCALAFDIHEQVHAH